QRSRLGPTLHLGYSPFRRSPSARSRCLASRRRRPPTSTLFPYTTLFRSYSRDLKRELAGHDPSAVLMGLFTSAGGADLIDRINRSEEHTSELQSRRDLVCRLLLEKKKIQRAPPFPTRSEAPAGEKPFLLP